MWEYQQHTTHAATRHNTQRLQSTDVLSRTKATWSRSRFQQDRAMNAKTTRGTGVVAENLDSNYESLL